MPADIIKVLMPAVVSFAVGIGITPLITHFLYAHKMWKKVPGKTALDGTAAVEFNKLHAEQERVVPRMGGIVIWASVLITISGIALLARFWPTAATLKLDFLSRDQTWIPLVALLIGAGVGFVSDLMDVQEKRRELPLWFRISLITALALCLGWWFYAKLDVVSIGIPFAEPLYVGWLIVPFFIMLALALYASGVIDGIDGLSGGVFTAVFASYVLIAYAQHQINLAAFAAAVVGGTLAFLWFNIPPARFYMTETGTMALTLTIAVIAFMTDTPGEGIGISVLPLIGFLLVLTVASNVLQVASKRLRGKKLFLVAPLHHHFEALGWPGYKVTMRYWILAIMFAFAGVIVALIGR